MQTRILLLVILTLASLFLISCNNEEPKLIIKECPDFTVEEGTISDDKEYQIIDAVIKNNFSHLEFINIINIPENIIIGPNVEEIQDYLLLKELEVENELIESYININSSTELRWKDSFEEGKLVSEEEKSCFYSDNEFPCESYQNKYPNGGGFLNFTRPGIFEDNKATIEYFYEYCSGIRGVFVILNFENGNWEVTDFFTTIVS